jgi:hypothetical protein
MKISLIVVATLALAMSPAFAKGTPPTAEQKADFLATCLKVAPEAGELCRCKADAAMSLIDTDFMAIVIASMKGKDVEAQYYDAYNDYIARSTEVCGMGSAM